MNRTIHILIKCLLQIQHWPKQRSFYLEWREENSKQININIHQVEKSIIKKLQKWIREVVNGIIGSPILSMVLREDTGVKDDIQTGFEKGE